jgi:hypothetical protein
MQCRITFILTVFLMAATSFVFAQTATPTATLPDNYDDTDAGTVDNPYQIATWQNLYWLSQNSDYWDAHFVQTADIDLGTASPTIQEWDDGKGWTPIGFFCPNNPAGNIPFTGIYDGLHDGIVHSITGLFADRTDDEFDDTPGEGDHEDPEICPITSAGLFGLVEGAEIRNLNLVDVDISGYSGAGSLAVLTISSTIENVSASGAVSGFDVIGGLIGFAQECTITNVSSSADINAIIFAGGLLGIAEESTIGNSSAAGSVSSNDLPPPNDGPGPQGGKFEVFRMFNQPGHMPPGASTSDSRFSGFALGGFIGDAYGCTIEQSYSTGNVQGNEDIGGFASYIDNNTVIRESFSTSTVTGATSIGGFVGLAWNGEIHNSYHQGDVSGDNHVGGFIGNVSTATITFSYSAGSVTGVSNFNGFIGQFDDSEWNSLSIENSFWDVDTDGISGTSSGDDNEGAIGKSTLELQSIFTFPAEDGWSILEDPDIPRDYPLLTWHLDSNAKQRGTWTLGSGDPPAIPLPGWSTWITLLLMSFVAIAVALRKPL